MFEPFLAYEASAGSGKTFNLVVRYLSLLFMGEDPNSITALTFTNKAANEMMERVMQTLLHLHTKEGERQQIAHVSGLMEEEILARRDEVLRRFLRSEIHISTIDAFFGTVLRQFSLNAGIMPTYATTQNHHEMKLLERFLHEVEVSNQSQTLVRLSLLSDKRLGDLFTLMGQLYSKHKELETLTFDPPDTSDYATRAMADAEELMNLMAEKTLSERARKTMEIKSYDDLLSKTWLLKPSLEYWDFKKVFEPIMDTLLGRIQEAVMYQMRQKEARYFQELFGVLRLYIKSRQSLIIQTSTLSFDDITLMVYNLLKEKVESEFLYFRLDSRLKHLLLDEFQDTSLLQFDILRPLIEEIRSGEGVNSGGSFFFVGDVKQSIYRFRGGVSALFYEVAEYFDVHVEPLRVNYRSHSAIVDFVNHTFSGKIRGYVHQESQEKLLGGYVRVRKSDDVLSVLEEQIAELVFHKIAPEEIAVLCATNKDGSLIEEYLGALGYEVVSETTAKLIHQHSVRAIIEYLRYCYFGVPLYRYNCAALIGVDPQSIERLTCEDMIATTIRFIRTWSIGDKSALMFLESLRTYRDIEEMVFEIDQLEAASPQSELRGIRVMTVHKSKGLEFEHVIVCDRLGQSKSKNDPIVFEYEHLRLNQLFYRIKGREFLDPPYAQALEKEKKLSDEDQMNALYVALTRAVHSLSIIVKEERSWFEPLGLEEGVYGEIRYSSAKTQSETEMKSPLFRGLQYGKQEESIRTLKEETYDYAAVQFGLALHYALEMMSEFQMEALSEALEATRNRYGATLEVQSVAKIEQRITRLVQDEHFKVLSKGVCFKEQMIRYNGALGILDLLVQHENDWVILDYKSGREGEEKHRVQVQWYMSALRSFGYENVRGYVCYILDESIEWIECL